MGRPDRADSADRAAPPAVAAAAGYAAATAPPSNRMTAPDIIRNAEREKVYAYYPVLLPPLTGSRPREIIPPECREFAQLVRHGRAERGHDTQRRESKVAISPIQISG